MKTNDKLLDYLKIYGPLRVFDMAAALELTPADIRYQLRMLMSAGLVQSINPEPSVARGRPAAKFEVVSQVPLANATNLLELFADYFIIEYPRLSYEELAGMMWKKTRKNLSLSPTPYVKVTQILRFLESLGVKTSWEAGKSGPTIKVIHNPFDIKTNPRTFAMLADSLVNHALRDAIKV